MAHQYSTDVNNARLNAIETIVGASPILELRTGPKPANCAAANSGTLLVQSALPADWLADAAAGVKGKAGAWSFVGIAAGAVGHFRIFSAGSPSVCHLQGSVTLTGGGGDMTIDNTSIEAAQAGSVTAFQITAGNA